MRLSYYTREGHFNWFDTSEVSFSCNVAAYDDTGERIKVCNFTPEYEENGTDPEDAIALIEDSMKRYWSTNDDRKDMIQFLTDNMEAIREGNDLHELETINKDIERLQARKVTLEDRKK